MSEFSNLHMENVKQYYMTIYSVTYSTCGNYLAAGNSYGQIAVFNFTPIFEYNNNLRLDEKLRQAFFKFTAHRGPIYSMASTQKLIISGSVGEICAWPWSDVKRKENKTQWKLTIPQGDNLTMAEVNSLAVCSTNESLLYAGCGDDTIYCFDIDAATIMFTLSGHTDYIHCITLIRDAQECVSASEDGSVRIWDARKGGKEVQIIEPYKHEMASRPQFGKWIGCVDVDDTSEWLVCGGAPVLCMWHLGSLLPATQLLKQDATSSVVRFHEDSIISGGSEACVNHWSFDGQLMTEVPTSASSIFDINIYSNSSQEILCASGSSYKIDVCNDFRFKEFSLIFK